MLSGSSTLAALMPGWRVPPSPPPTHPYALQVALRVRREGSDYIVEACVPQDTLTADCTHNCPVKVGSAAPDRCVVTGPAAGQLCCSTELVACTTGVTQTCQRGCQHGWDALV